MLACTHTFTTSHALHNFIANHQIHTSLRANTALRSFGLNAGDTQMGNATGVAFANAIQAKFNVRGQALAVVNAGWPAFTVPIAVRTVVINTFIDGVDDTVSDDGHSQRSQRSIVPPLLSYSGGPLSLRAGSTRLMSTLILLNLKTSRSVLGYLA